MAVKLYVLLKNEAEQWGQIYSTVDKEHKPWHIVLKAEWVWGVGGAAWHEKLAETQV